MYISVNRKLEFKVPSEGERQDKVLLLHRALDSRGIAFEGCLVIAQNGKMNFTQNDVVTHVGDLFYGFFN